MARTDARPTAAGGDRPHGQRSPYVHGLSPRKGSALEPQRLSRRRFPLSTPFGVTGPMKTRPRLAVRNLLPRVARDERPATAQTASERIGDEASPNPGVDPLALVTDGGGLRCRRTDRASIGDEAAGSGSMGSTAAAARSSSPAGPLRPRGNHRRAHRHRHHRPSRCHSRRRRAASHRARPPSSRSGSSGPQTTVIARRRLSIFPTSRLAAEAATA